MRYLLYNVILFRDCLECDSYIEKVTETCLRANDWVICFGIFDIIIKRTAFREKIKFDLKFEN